MNILIHEWANNAKNQIIFKSIYIQNDMIYITLSST